LLNIHLFTYTASKNHKEKTMTTLTTIEVNCETGEVTERPFTAEEIAQREVNAAAHAAAEAEREAEAAATAAAKEAATSKLTALGLTAEEIAALTK
jgi:hypothetical protein